MPVIVIMSFPLQTVVIVGTPESDVVDSGRFKYYELPFLNEGITITLYVQQGLLICYASDLVRNPSEDQYIWKVETDRYVDVYLDPTTLLRPAEAYVYVSLMGTHGTNSFTINSTSSDTSTKGKYLSILILLEVVNSIILDTYSMKNYFSIIISL